MEKWHVHRNALIVGVLALVVLALLWPLAAYGGIYNNTGDLSEDSISLAIILLDTLGNPVVIDSTLDSAWIVTYYPNGDSAWGDAIALKQAEATVELYTNPAFGGDIRAVYKNAVANIDGSGINGTYSYDVMAKDSSLSLWTIQSGEFQVLTSGDLSTTVDSVTKVSDALIVNLDNATGTLANSQVDDDVDVNTKTITADAITATAIQANAITNAKVSSDVLPDALPGANSGLLMLEVGSTAQGPLVGSGGATYSVLVPTGSDLDTGIAAIKTKLTTIAGDVVNLDGGTLLTTSDNIGINWADISNPTTTIDLAGTTIKTVDNATRVDSWLDASSNTLKWDILYQLLGLVEAPYHGVNAVVNGSFENTSIGSEDTDWGSSSWTQGAWTLDWYCDSTTGSGNIQTTVAGEAPATGEYAMVFTITADDLRRTLHSRPMTLARDVSYQYGCLFDFNATVPTVCQLELRDATGNVLDSIIMTHADSYLESPYIPFAGVFSVDQDTVVSLYFNAEFMHTSGSEYAKLDNAFMTPVSLDSISVVANAATIPDSLLATVPFIVAMKDTINAHAPHDDNWGGNTSAGSGSVVCSLYTMKNCATTCVAIPGARIYIYNSTLTTQLYANPQSGSSVTGLSVFNLDASTTYKITAQKTPDYTYDSLSTYQTILTPSSGKLIDTIPMTQIVIGSPSSPTLKRIYGWEYGSNITDTTYVIPLQGLQVTYHLDLTPQAGQICRDTAAGVNIPYGLTLLARTDANGYWHIDVPLNNNIVPTGSKATVTCSPKDNSSPVRWQLTNLNFTTTADSCLGGCP